jgi:hypothetical protein
MKRKSLVLRLLGSAGLLPLLCTASAMAQGGGASAPGAGSFPGSFLVPGTNTSFKVGGYAKLDIWYDFGTHQDLSGSGGTGVTFNAIPLDANVPGSTASTGHNIHGNVRLSAAESRFNIQTRTPTAYGELKTFVEGDFEGASGVAAAAGLQVNSNSTSFRLRRAEGTLGPWLFGQTFPLFEDTNATAETLDFGGSFGGGGPLRQPEIRYSYDAGNGLLFGAALDNPQTQFISAASGASSTTFGTKQGDKVPDAIVAAIWNQPWGHVSLRGVFRDLYDHNGSNVALSTFGWGGNLSGNLNTVGKDSLFFGVQGGNGIGRYSQNTGTAPGDVVINAAGTQIKTVDILVGGIGYVHYWTDMLRSNVEGSMEYNFYPKSLFSPASFEPSGAYGGLDRRLITSHVNLIWSPIPEVDIGAEFSFGQRITNAGQRGSIERGQFSTKFKF